LLGTVQFQLYIVGNEGLKTFQDGYVQQDIELTPSDGCRMFGEQLELSVPPGDPDHVFAVVAVAFRVVVVAFGVFAGMVVPTFVGMLLVFGMPMVFVMIAVTCAHDQDHHSQRDQ
jgi:hypothetical protein